MVCIYCAGQTHVINSRPQKRYNTVWRRRKCRKCAAIFSSIEAAAYETTIVVQTATSHIVPLSRDRLFLSIYEACRHRSTAIEDATALTATVLGKLLGTVRDGRINRHDIVTVTSTALRHFDRVAQVQYDAFHPLTV